MTVNAERTTAVDVADLFADPPVSHPALRWLNELYGNAEEGWLTLFSVNRKTGARHVDWALTDKLHSLAGVAMTRSKTCDVWHGVATRKQRLSAGRGGATDCLAFPGLWLDIDVAGPGHLGGHPLPPDEDAAFTLIDDFRLPPTAVVHSGGGLQAWWLFGELVALDRVGPLLRDWGHTWTQIAQKRDWWVDNVFDPARVMRLPGTFNRKGEPLPVRILERRTR